MAKEMMKDTQNAITRDVASLKSRADLSPIQEDFETLKEDARILKEDAKVLGRDLQVEGRKQLSRAEEKAKEALESAREQGKDQFAEIAAFVQRNPGQSLAVAFVGGIVASMLLGGRR